MGMSIDEAIKQLTTYTIPCGKYKDAYDMAIDTMRKYKKIEQAYSAYLETMNPDTLADLISTII